MPLESKNNAPEDGGSQPRSLQEILDGLPALPSVALKEVDTSTEDNFMKILIDAEKRNLVKRLYEGIPNCSCCHNWVEEYPHDAKEAIKHEWKKAGLLLRYAKSHKALAASPLQLHSIAVQGAAVKSLVQFVLDGYPGLDTHVQELVFEAPFHPFFHRWARLEEVLSLSIGDEKYETLTLFRDILHAELKDDLQRSKELLSHQNIDYKLLWTIFPPGCVVLMGQELNEQCALVIKCSYVKTSQDSYLDLKVTHLDFDGDDYGWRQKSIHIAEFQDVVSVSELDVIPKEYHTSADQTIHGLAKRGERALALQHNGYQAFKGIISGVGYVDGRIVVDAEEFEKQSSNYSNLSPYPRGLKSLVPAEEDISNGRTGGRRSGSFDSSDDETRFYTSRRGRARSTAGSEPLNKSKVTSSETLLRGHQWTTDVVGVVPEAFCPPVVRGYCLTSKKWASFSVDCISAIDWNDDAFDRLVMPQPRKRLLKALVEEHGGHKTALDDVIKGKGQGLILLLDGPPGCGKTLTAESIADRLRLPLYALDASQLSDSIERLEDELKEVFRLAGAWDAVLLLDEADAFLERRSSDPDALRRNKRVAMFLRILEYFRGVLILTSNRMVQFDDAFYSRIHLTLRYAALDREARRAVWTSLLASRSHAISDEDLTIFADEDLNGRQIKNVLKMAWLLAKNEGSTLMAEHVQDVMGVVRGYI